MTITVHGTPAPQGSKKGFYNKNLKRVQLVESSNAVKPWREAVKHAALAAMEPGELRPIFPGAVQVTVQFVFPRPKSAAKRPHMMTKPDIDKLQRSTFDALKDAGVFLDDSRIVGVGAVKVYSTPEMVSGAVIEVKAA